MDEEIRLKRSFFLASPVLIVEDEPAVKNRLYKLLLDIGYEPFSLQCASNVREAQAICSTQKIALALVDLGLPDGDGYSLIENLRAKDAEMMILVISAWKTEDSIIQSLKAGATGYLLKERDDLEIKLGIASALRGGAPIDPFVAKRMLQDFAAAAVDKPIEPIMDALESKFVLTAREKEILRLVAQGLTNREIAENLGLSKLTVDSHVKNIYQKMSVTSRTKAVHRARENKLLD